jgi:alpha-L-fucosidase 2
MGFSQHNNSLKLWYNKPAEKWVEVFTGWEWENRRHGFWRNRARTLQLNESTLWSGGPVKNAVNPEAKNYLPKIREALLKNENYTEANQLAKKMQGTLFTVLSANGRYNDQARFWKLESR